MSEKEKTLKDLTITVSQYCDLKGVIPLERGAFELKYKKKKKSYEKWDKELEKYISKR